MLLVQEGLVYRNQGKHEEALAMYEKGSVDQIEEIRKDHPLVVHLYNNMAGVYYKQDKSKEALQCTRRLCRSD